MSEWIEYTGSEEQIKEIRHAESGFICKNNDTESGLLTIKYGQLKSDASDYPILNTEWQNALINFIRENKTTHYLICKPRPLAEMIRRQALTGQPVWMRMTERAYWITVLGEYDGKITMNGKVVIKSFRPNWNIQGAEYSFTEFKEDV